ncbi:MAG: ATP-binding protein [Vulcanimicrobiota bacterium]
MSATREKAILSQLSVESYRRFFNVSVFIYPMAILYLSGWVPLPQRPGYLALRACVWVLLFAVERKSRKVRPVWLRLFTAGFLAVGLIGNALLISSGGPNLLTVLTHAALILLGVLEFAPPSAFFLGSVFLLMWRVISMTVSSQVGLAASGLPFSLGLSLFMVHRRGSALRHLARLLAQQEHVNTRLAQAVSLVDDCNGLLRARVEARNGELEEAQIRLTRVQSELVFSHQEQVKLQAEWLQACRLETLERFGKGLSHSFSNGITSLWMGVERLRIKPCTPDFQAALDDIEQACDRAAEICRRMALNQAISASAEKPLNVGRRLQDSLAWLQKSLNNPIVLQIEGNFWVSGETAVFDQIIWNLVRNASLASRPEEAITITVSCHSAGSGEVRIQDRGTGIDPEIMPYVFEPFYTTRGPGQGHGLGLSIVKEGAQRLGGSCSLESASGQGTTVSLKLPTCGDPPLEAPQPEAEGPRPLKEGLRLCLVEDQETLRKLIANYLRKNSHQLLVASSAEEVIPSQDVEVLITDVTLPGMSGLELAHQWTASHPGLKVIFMSGYPFDAGSVQMDPSSWVFLPKPFRLSQLLEHLDRLC